jgi:SAM-dependent methyltransferase
LSQAEHYNAIIEEYDRHYYDETSMAWRRRFAYPPLFRGLDLNDRSVAELACGSGHNTLELLRLFPRAKPIGLDVSPRACEAYAHKTGCQSFVVDLSNRDAQLPAQVETAFIVGGLHHCVNDLPAALENLARLVQPGGLLLMLEPSSRFFLNGLRTFWYRKDKWFREEEEAPLDHDEVLALARPAFELHSVSYHGGLAYFFVANSLVMRVPLGMKRALTPPLFAMETAYAFVPWQRAFPFFVAHWRRAPALRAN